MPAGVSNDGSPFDPVGMAADKMEVIPERTETLPPVKLAEIDQEPDFLMPCKETVQVLNVVFILLDVDLSQ